MVAKTPAKSAFDLAVLLAVARPEEDVADLRARRVRHLLHADDEHHPSALRLDEVEPLVDRGGAGRAGVLDPGGRGETEPVVGLEDERRGEVLGGEAVVEEPYVDGVDVLRPDPRVRHRVGGDAADEGLDVLALEPSEPRMRPAHDATRHVLSSRNEFRPGRRRRDGGAGNGSSWLDVPRIAGGGNLRQSGTPGGPAPGHLPAAASRRSRQRRARPPSSSRGARSGRA